MESLEHSRVAFIFDQSEAPLPDSAADQQPVVSTDDEIAAASDMPMPPPLPPMLPSVEQSLLRHNSKAPRVRFSHAHRTVHNSALEQDLYLVPQPLPSPAPSLFYSEFYCDVCTMPLEQGTGYTCESRHGFVHRCDVWCSMPHQPWCL